MNKLFLKCIILIRYGELTLKGKNRSSFVNLLAKNIRKALCNFNFNLKIKYDSMEIDDFNQNEIREIINILTKIPGISVINIGYKLSLDLDLLSQIVLSNLNENLSFKLECSRKDKSYHLTSLEIIKKIVAFVLKKKQFLKVDLHNPQQKIFIEVYKNYFLIFVQKISGACGLPVGTSGKVLVLLSGGIDSPVAAYTLMNRGMKVDFLTFITPPHTTELILDKVKKLTQIITNNGLLCDSKLYVVNFSKVIRELNHIDPESYKIVMLRRYFLKFAEILTNRDNFDAISTGESLGQVASQTIASLKTISSATPNLLILRPLIGMDKNKIIEIAKKIKTYDTSILPYDDTCSLFVPKNPITMPKKNIADKIDQEFNYIDILISKLDHNDIEIIKVQEIDRTRN
ncbi:tRNA uracil 4-sulfurtransferase ThiI [Mycoplasmoides alvi]|uniref:tRNA uracil 4-sulfurtransferase ThiI n=1 Tax=Mycoplasmoides alvi TaxID=78580 RepID=UPI00051BB566|nr:tRNA uracil 4-sulfurtransferase ThiI [Mycoplasmoides alvi]